MPPLRLRRHHDAAPRLELAPLIDVIFVLLTFFIFFVVQMGDRGMFSVRLTDLATPSASGGGGALEPGRPHTLLVDSRGELQFDFQPIKAEDVDQRLNDYARQEPRGKLYVGMEAQSAVDRGPALMRLLERVHRAGIKEFVLVGAPPGKAP